MFYIKEEDLHIKFDGITLKFKLKTNRRKKLKLAKTCVSSPPFLCILFYFSIVTVLYSIFFFELAHVLDLNNL